jgi:hexosaminidase
MAQSRKIILRVVLFIAVLTLILAVAPIFYYNQLSSSIEKKMNQQAEKHPIMNYDSSGMVSKSEVLNLLPVPKIVQFKPGIFRMPSGITYFVEKDLQDETGSKMTQLLHRRSSFSSGGAIITFVHQPDLGEQAYRLSLAPDFITIRYSSPVGIYYALVSLKILIVNYNNEIPCVEIEDSPDLEVRGVLLDISRDKVPTLETLKKLTELLADLKYNHLELYTEGFSFAYPTFKSSREGKETPLTGLEMRELDSWCRDRYIDLVPNQNSLGHMTSWLAMPEYRDLAECPKGFKMMGQQRPAGTLDPSNPGSIELIRRMSDDLLPNFTSGYFNVNLDEPFELGQGKSRKLAKKEGAGKLYFDYLMKMDELVRSRNRKMLMWGDIVLKHPEIIPDIPKDITVLDWGYEAEYPFEKNAQTLRKTGHNFYVCPGTSSWNSFTGRTENMLSNIENAARAGFHNGAKGILITDWGDNGHLQYLTASYPGFSVGASLGWNSASRKQMPLEQFLSSYVFRDKEGILGPLVMDMGRYNRFEEFPMFNGSSTAMTIQLGIRDKVFVDATMNTAIAHAREWFREVGPELEATVNERFAAEKSYDFEGLENFLSDMDSSLNLINTAIPDGNLIRDEYLNSIRMIRLGAQLKRYILIKNSSGSENILKLLQEMKSINQRIIEEHKRLWAQRNKSGGIDRSLAPFLSLQNQLDTRIASMQKPALIRWCSRFIEIIAEALAVFQINRGS